MEAKNEKVQILIEMPMDKFTEVVLLLDPIKEERNLPRDSGLSLLTDQILDQLRGRNIPMLGRVFAVIATPKKRKWWQKRKKSTAPVLMGFTYALNDVIAPSNLLGGMKDWDPKLREYGAFTITAEPAHIHNVQPNDIQE